MRTPDARASLVRSVTKVINQHSAENASNTPDFILAEMMVSALEAFEEGSRARECWFDKALTINNVDPPWTEKANAPVRLAKANVPPLTRQKEG